MHYDVLHMMVSLWVVVVVLLRFEKHVSVVRFASRLLDDPFNFLSEFTVRHFNHHFYILDFNVSPQQHERSQQPNARKSSGLVNLIFTYMAIMQAFMALSLVESDVVLEEPAMPNSIKDSSGLDAVSVPLLMRMTTTSLPF